MRHWARSRNAARIVGVVTTVAAVALVEGLTRAGVINAFVVPLPTQILAAIPRIVAEENVLHRFWQTTLEVVWASLLLAGVGIALGALLYRFTSLRLAFETWVGALAAAPIVLMYPLFLVIFGRSTTTIVMIGFAAGLAPVILKTVEGLAGTRKVLIDVGRSFKLTPAQQFRKVLAAGGVARRFRRPAARPHLRDDQHRRRRVPDQFRRPRASSSTSSQSATTSPAPTARSCS